MSRKVYILGHNKTYKGNRTNKTAAWKRIVELLETEELSITYDDKNDPEYFKTVKGTYANFNKAFKTSKKVLVHPTDDYDEKVAVWEGLLNEG